MVTTQTGAIYGIASSPDFDPNNYSTIVNEILNSKIPEDTTEIFEKLKADNTEHLADSELLCPERLAQWMGLSYPGIVTEPEQ